MQIPPSAESSETPDNTSGKPAPPPAKKAGPTQFFLKGLAIVLPPILTLVILIWIGQMIYSYVVSPVTTGVRLVIAQIIDRSRPTASLVAASGLPALEYCGNDYRIPEEAAPELLKAADDARADRADASGRKPLNSVSQSRVADVAYVPFGEWSVPYHDFARVAARMRPADWPATTTSLYMELVTIRYFKSLGSLSALATALTIIALYFLGRFVTARMGQWLVSRFETLVLARVPIISSVYSSVKQVTDFFFSERQMTYNRVVAVEFPRRGIWTIGFAMGESLVEMTLSAGEQMISIMIPAAPMPMTGWVVSVPKSAIIDLNMTLDQAFQYFLSCGVLVPEHQRSTPELLHRELAKRLSGAFGPGGALNRTPPFAAGDSPLPHPFVSRGQGDGASQDFSPPIERFPDRSSPEGDDPVL